MCIDVFPLLVFRLVVNDKAFSRRLVFNGKLNGWFLKVVLGEL
jgi:hypothetical protein